MSVQDRPKRLSVTQVQSRKGGDKLVCLTAYTSSVARLVDHEVDLLLVGDSLAMTVYGFASKPWPARRDTQKPASPTSATRPCHQVSMRI